MNRTDVANDKYRSWNEVELAGAERTRASAFYYYGIFALMIKREIIFGDTMNKDSAYGGRTPRFLTCYRLAPKVVEDGFPFEEAVARLLVFSTSLRATLFNEFGLGVEVACRSFRVLQQ
jgi:hypothetical protein